MKRPMLAEKAILSKLTYPVLVSPKIDGIRAIVLPDEDGTPVLRSRSMKPIPNRYINAMLAREEFLHADGELVVGDVLSPLCMNNSTSGVMSIEGEPDFTYFIFDYIDFDLGFEYRLKMAKEFFHECSKCRTQIVFHTIVHSEAQLLKYRERFTQSGYEGLMIRSLDGKYKQGRSTVKEGALLKLKLWEDSEAVIIGFEEELENTNPSFTNEVGRTSRSTAMANLRPKGRLGNLLVRDVKTRIEFSVGSGLCDLDKTTIWNDQISWIGRIIKYKHFPVGVKEKPRFPVYLGVRDERDM